MHLVQAKLALDVRQQVIARLRFRRASRRRVNSLKMRVATRVRYAHGLNALYRFLNHSPYRVFVLDETNVILTARKGASWQNLERYAGVGLRRLRGGCLHCISPSSEYDSPSGSNWRCSVKIFFKLLLATWLTSAVQLQDTDVLAQRRTPVLIGLDSRVSIRTRLTRHGFVLGVRAVT